MKSSSTNPFAASSSSTANPFDDEPKPRPKTASPGKANPFDEAPKVQQSTAAKKKDAQSPSSHNPFDEPSTPPTKTTLVPQSNPFAQSETGITKTPSKTNPFAQPDAVTETPSKSNPFAQADTTTTKTPSKANPFAQSESVSSKTPSKSNPFAATSTTTTSSNAPTKAAAANPFDEDMFKRKPAAAKPISTPVPSQSKDTPPSSAAPSTGASVSTASSSTPIVVAPAPAKTTLAAPATANVAGTISSSNAGGTQSKGMNGYDSTLASIDRITSTVFTQEFDCDRFISDLTKPFFQRLATVNAKEMSTATGAAELQYSNNISYHIDDMSYMNYDFNPQPLELCFRKLQTHVSKLRDEIDDEIQDQCKRTSEAEFAHQNKMQELQSVAGSIQKKFAVLDSRISSVGNIAVRIGSTLESIDSQKSHTIQAADVITHFLAFNTGDINQISPIFTTNDPKDIFVAAELIQILLQICDEIVLKDSSKAIELINKVSGNIENQLLTRFVKAFDTNDIDEMRRCASVCLGFKGRNIVRRYVFRIVSDFDIHNSRGSLRSSADGTRHPKDAVNPFAANGDTDSTDDENEDHFSVSSSLTSTIPSSSSKQVQAFRTELEALFHRIYKLLRDQSALCMIIFPQPVVIIKTILERLFVEKVAEFIDTTLNALAKSQSKSSKKSADSEEYLSILSSAYALTKVFVEKLRNFLKVLPTNTGNSVVNPSGTTNPYSAASSMVTSSAIQDAQSSLTDYISSLFSRYKSEYIIKEGNFLQSTYHEQIIEVLQGIHDSSTHPVASSTLSTSTLANVTRRLTPHDRQQILIKALENEYVDNILKLLSRSLQRVDLLSDPQTVPEHVNQLFQIIIQAVVNDYLTPILVECNVHLPVTDAKTEPEPFWLSVTRLVNSICNRLQQNYAQWVLPRISVDPNTQSACERVLQESLSTLESHILNALQRMQSAYIRYIQRLISKQRTNDYKPRDDNALFDNSGLEFISTISNAVLNISNHVMENLDGKNADAFLTAFGFRLHDCIAEHLQKLQVNTLGAGLLLRDVKEYEAMVRTFHIPAVSDRFADLRVITNVFFVDVDNIRAWLNEPRINRMDRDDLHNYIKMRADYSQNKANIVAILQ